MKRYSGIRQINDNTYEINFRSSKGADRVFKRIKANSKQDASLIRADLISKSKAELTLDKSGIKEASFDEIWPFLEDDLVSDNKPQKTVMKFKKIYDRVFDDFIKSKFPNIEKMDQLNLSFFINYKSYFVNDLKHPNGFRAELIIVKAMMRRLYKLNFCPEAVIKALVEIKKPKAIKKDYPEISNTKISELLNHAKNERPDIYSPAYFMKRTGRRVEETVLIERKDIVWDGITPIRINIRAETRKMKDFAPLNLYDIELQSFIRKAYQESLHRKAPYLFLNRQSKKLNQRKISDYLGEISEKLLGVRVTSHYFRHRFCTECGKANLPIVDVMAVCGLKDVGVLTKYYSHSTSEGQTKVFEKTRI